MLPFSSRLTASHKIVLPFYLYAALAFLSSTILLLNVTMEFSASYIEPELLAVTHVMALGWGTMIIFGASHQLVPVLIEHPWYSHKLAYATFVLAALGVPLLAWGFYAFDMGWPAKWGGRLVVLAVLAYLINLLASFRASKQRNVHAMFVLTAAIWLFATTLIGLVLVYNFTFKMLDEDSLAYLPLHAHTGIIGWFLLLVFGVGSKLIPMFLISKYQDARGLWLIYALINGGLISFVVLFYTAGNEAAYFWPLLLLGLAILLFARYIILAYRLRIRKQLDEQLKTSLLSIALMALPVLFLVILLTSLSSMLPRNEWIKIYGFTIFFGWLTSIILGMTFKTLPFIIWNKVYHARAGKQDTPSPKDLYNGRLFNVMVVAYLLGFFGFIAGVLLESLWKMQVSAILLIIAASLYNWNVIRLLYHKPERDVR